MICYRHFKQVNSSFLKAFSILFFSVPHKTWYVSCFLLWVSRVLILCAIVLFELWWCVLAKMGNWQVLFCAIVRSINPHSVIVYIHVGRLYWPEEHLINMDGLCRIKLYIDHFRTKFVWFIIISIFLAVFRESSYQWCNSNVFE